MARPGLLTRRYIDGQRARHVPPLALFLFTVFLSFLVVSLTSTGIGIGTSAAASGGSSIELADAAGAPAGTAASGAAGLPPGKRIETGSIGLNAVLEHVLENPDLAFYKLRNTTCKFSFLLVPLLLPFMWLMFIGRRDLAVYDHAVFALYSLSFMALLAVATALLSLTPLDGHLGWLLWLVPLHVFLHLRGTYGLTRWGASWRTGALLAGFVGAMFLLFSAWASWH